MATGSVRRVLPDDVAYQVLSQIIFHRLSSLANGSLGCYKAGLFWTGNRKQITPLRYGEYRELWKIMNETGFPEIQTRQVKATIDGWRHRVHGTLLTMERSRQICQKWATWHDNFQWIRRIDLLCERGHCRKNVSSGYWAVYQAEAWSRKRLIVPACLNNRPQ